MTLRAALFSGGKDSVYAALLEWPVDLFVTFVYEFPRPSPHLINISKAVELAGAMSVPMVVLRVHRGREMAEEAALMRSLGVSRIVAGDQGVEDHLKYMEAMAAEAGAELSEPLWGLDQDGILEGELEETSFMVIGAEERARELVCRRVGRDGLDAFRADARRMGISPIGEAGEYHSLVTQVRRLNASIEVGCREVRSYDGYSIALVDRWPESVHDAASTNGLPAASAPTVVGGPWPGSTS
jgi:diphthamide synthase (EF-2-diphthine--ammonia ligase)